MEDKSNSRTIVKITQVLFYFNALIWLTFAVISLVRMASNESSQTITMLVVAVLMFGNVAALLLAGFGVGTGKRGFYVFALLVLAANIVLTFTDEFGLFDFLTVVLDFVLLSLVILVWRRTNMPAET